ncbi:uncharacterized protein [Venturia canescens]|uniref:uncharacterized protein n=1 Tax=Venturia canescens TaxID=32260 RepID=UPI001C9C5520|nr:uncharacterized protein LOC122417891 [Venturia canescens]XP_043287710.1 uncharacterized protein LOC122417891 [Venturia canescens]
MDWRNRDTDYTSVDDLQLEDSKNLLAKSRSDASIFNLGGCDVCTEETEIDYCDSDSKDFALAFDRLRLGVSDDSRDAPLSNFGDRGTQTCPCPDCTENSECREIKSREISSMKLVVQGPEILNYQGYQYTPDDIARYWKKDSRMWLWKSVRLARRKMAEAEAKTLPIDCGLKKEQSHIME